MSAVATITPPQMVMPVAATFTGLMLSPRKHAEKSIVQTLLVVESTELEDTDVTSSERLKR